MAFSMHSVLSGARPLVPASRALTCRTSTTVVAACAPRQAHRLAARPSVRVAFQPDLAPSVTTSQHASLALPFSYPQLLGFPLGTMDPKDSDVTAAFDDITSCSPVTGYSGTTLYSRQELLKMAKRLILDSKAKRTGGMVPPAGIVPSMSLPVDMVPAALAILAEVGHTELVLELGQQLLTTPELAGADEAHDDILLSMALAYCDMARTALEPGSQDAGNQVSAACLHLEEAQQLLQSAAQPPLAPGLAQEIQNGLRRLRAPSIQEELLGSGSSTRRSAASVERRKRAIRSLRELLRDASVPVNSQTAGSGAAGSAVAHRLSSLLRGVGSGSNTGSNSMAGASGAAQADAAPALDQGTVRQLVGSLTCEELVHLMEWEQVAKTAASCTWLYPGLLQTVAAGHIVTGFRQRQPAYIKLAASVLRQLPQTARVLAMEGVCQLLLGSVQSAVQLLKQAEAIGDQGAEHDSDVQDVDERWTWGAHAYVVQNSPEGEDGLLPGLCAWTELWLKKVAFQLFADASTTSPSASLSKYFDDTRVEALIAVYDEKGASGPGRQALESVIEAVRDAKAALSAAAAPPAGGVASRLTAITTAPSGAKAVLAAGVALAALGLAVAGSMLLGTARRDGPASGPATSVLMRAPWARGTGVGHPAAVEVEMIDAQSGERLIRGWQVAKQMCLGAGHDTSPLAAVLTGHALGEAEQRSADFKDKGCHMQYKLWKCQVTDVKHVSKGAVQLTAVLDESASMLSQDGRMRDFYRSSYESRYHAVKCRDGAWRITRIMVVGENTSANQS